MKKLSVLGCLLLTVLCANAQLNVMTFNIRLSTLSDSANAWIYRADKVSSQILFHEADIIGVQEALHSQMLDLQNDLNGFKYVGVGRADGKQDGEYSAIFYNTKKIQLLASKTFWLSETPTVPGSKSWDAAITRIVTWAKFKDKKTNKTFFVFNTHFDHMGKVARRESAKLLLKKINEIAGKLPVIVTGDFNSKPSDEPIQVLVNAESALKLIDTKTITKQPHYGPTGTFNAFGPKEINDEPIDYIFIKNGFKVSKHATLSQTWNGLFSSDHFPVFARLHF
jgi:endonuclease/exonuclease/phosphatase family metal-dependent hydrolase